MTPLTKAALLRVSKIYHRMGEEQSMWYALLDWAAKEDEA